MKDRKEFFSNLPEIDTERLLLRKVTRDDLNDIFEYTSNENVTKYLRWSTHESVEVTRKYIDDVLNEYSDGKDSPWMIEYKTQKKVIGAIHIIVYDEKNKRSEIGYVLSEKYWNKGIMTEALKAVISYCFDVLGFNRVQLQCKSENGASEKVIGKSGSQFEGQMREFVYEKARYWDIKIFSVLKNEYDRKTIK